MSNQQQVDSKQVLTPAPQTVAAMRALTVQDMRAVVGGPEIRNGDMGIIATPPTSTPGS